MAGIRLTKSPPPCPSSPTITFVHQRDVRTLARLLAEHRGRQHARDRFHGLIYSFMIFDHYAEARQIHEGTRKGIGEAWNRLGADPVVQTIYQKVMPLYDGGRLRDIELDLPITSVSPIHDKSAPEGITAGTYRLNGLTSKQFAQIAWAARCNLLHGSYDPCDASVMSILNNVSRPMMALVWEMLKQTSGGLRIVAPGS